jgi:hypothetical protein
MSAAPTSEAEEFAKRGEEVYEREVLPRLGPDDQGKAVAIEVETGDYEVDKNEVLAAHRLRERHPTAGFWFRRVGSRYFYRFGHRAARQHDLRCLLEKSTPASGPSSASSLAPT